MAKTQNHGQNLIETRCINPVSKSFILHLHEVLTRDSPIHAWKGNTL